MRGVERDESVEAGVLKPTCSLCSIGGTEHPLQGSICGRLVKNGIVRTFEANATEKFAEDGIVGSSNLLH